MPDSDPKRARLVTLGTALLLLSLSAFAIVAPRLLDGEPQRADAQNPPGTSLATPKAGPSQPSGWPPSNDWLPAANRTFAGKTARVLRTTYDFSVSSSDSNNGLPLLGEAWIEFDREGEPVQYSATFRREDGSLVQFIDEVPGRIEIGFLTAHGPLGPCVLNVETPAGAMRKQLLPLFSSAEIAGKGFTDGGKLRDLPAAAVPAVGDLLDFSSRAVVLTDGADQVIGYDELNGLIIAVRYVQRNSGELTEEYASLITRIEILDPARANEYRNANSEARPEIGTC